MVPLILGNPHIVVDASLCLFKDLPAQPPTTHGLEALGIPELKVERLLYLQGS